VPEVCLACELLRWPRSAKGHHDQRSVSPRLLDLIFVRLCGWLVLIPTLSLPITSGRESVGSAPEGAQIVQFGRIDRVM
jgi:hypothetical protein